MGTSFNVERDSDRSVVSVTEGRVVVEPVTHFLPVFVLQEFKPKLRSVRLNKGQQTTAGSAGIEETDQDGKYRHRLAERTSGISIATTALRARGRESLRAEAHCVGK